MPHQFLGSNTTLFFLAARRSRCGHQNDGFLNQVEGRGTALIPKAGMISDVQSLPGPIVPPTTRRSIPGMLGHPLLAGRPRTFQTRTAQRKAIIPEPARQVSKAFKFSKTHVD
jgi:hypothetical protein